MAPYVKLDCFFEMAASCPGHTEFGGAQSLFLLAADAHSAEPKRVLMLHAFGHAYSPWSDMAASFRAEIDRRSPGPIDLYEVSLDTARVQDTKDEAPFLEYIHAVLSTRSPDLIVPVGAPAAFFLPAE
jgi:hypothetical protein